jgi:hypothetical protein
VTADAGVDSEGVAEVSVPELGGVDDEDEHAENTANMRSAAMAIARILFTRDPS